MAFIDDELEKIVETESRKVFDDSIRHNAQSANSAGLEVRVTRVYDGVGVHDGKDVCRWCLDRCGKNMTLQEAYSKGAFNRHPGCGCTIEYTSAKGVKTVQTGKYSGWNFAEELEKRKSIGLDEVFYADELLSRITPYIDVDKEMLIKDAADGGIYSGAYQQALNKTRPQLEKSIRSHIKEAELHEWKIQHPEKYMIDGDPSDPVDRSRAIRTWKRHKKRNAEMASIEIEVWRLLYGG